MSVSKRKRFEILKRDGFRCRYCGRTSATVELEVDHIKPRDKGGDDSPHNLAAACKSCNRGKHAVELDDITLNLDDPIEYLQRENEKIHTKLEEVKSLLEENTNQYTYYRCILLFNEIFKKQPLKFEHRDSLVECIRVYGYQKTEEILVDLHVEFMSTKQDNIDIFRIGTKFRTIVENPDR